MFTYVTQIAFHYVMKKMHIVKFHRQEPAGHSFFIWFRYGFLNNNLKFSNKLRNCTPWRKNSMNSYHRKTRFPTWWIRWVTTFWPPFRHGFTVEWGRATKVLIFLMIFRTGRFRAPILTWWLFWLRGSSQASSGVVVSIFSPLFWLPHFK